MKYKIVTVVMFGDRSQPLTFKSEKQDITLLFFTNPPEGNYSRVFHQKKRFT
jgi:hypothetical protein